MLPRKGRLRLAYLSHFSQPSTDRPVYRAIRRLRTGEMLEIGMGIGQRSARMIEVASHYHPAEQVRFIGIDPFEARSVADGPGVTLKMAHRLLSATGARVQLVPGDPLAGLARVANAVGQVDLIVVSHPVDRTSLAEAWFYIPRLMHDKTIVMRQLAQSGEPAGWQQMDRDKIERLAQQSRRRAA